MLVNKPMHIRVRLVRKIVRLVRGFRVPFGFSAFCAFCKFNGTFLIFSKIGRADRRSP